MPASENLKHLATSVGSRIDLVQGSGGNVSEKNEDSIYVKASGKRLKDANVQEIFVELSLEEIQKNDILTIDDFSGYGIHNYASGNLTPSIETNFHCLLPGKFVTHVHSFWSVLLGSIQKQTEFLRDLEMDMNIQMVEYQRPGMDLAKGIFESAQRNHGYSEIYLLNNHGLIVSHDSFEKSYELIDQFESRVRSLFESKFVKANPLQPEYDNFYLTPDHAVFSSSTSETDSKNETLQHYRSIIQYASTIGLATRLKPLSHSEYTDLISWEKEQYRLGVSK